MNGPFCRAVLAWDLHHGGHAGLGALGPGSWGVAGLEEQRPACPACLVQRALLLVARAAVWPKITLPRPGEGLQVGILLMGRDSDLPSPCSMSQLCASPWRDPLGPQSGSQSLSSAQSTSLTPPPLHPACLHHSPHPDQCWLPSRSSASCMLQWMSPSKGRGTLCLALVGETPITPVLRLCWSL